MKILACDVCHKTEFGINRVGWFQLSTNGVIDPAFSAFHGLPCN
jgi:hypothetical protein